MSGNAGASYVVTLTPAGGTPVTLTGTASPIALPNLAPNTQYSVSLATNCAAGNTAPAVTTTFSTPLPACPPPSNPQATVTSSTTAVLDFAPVGAPAGSYTITLTPPVGTPIVVMATTNPAQITGLTPRTTYAVSIVSNCTGTATATSTAVTTTFSTPSAPCTAPAFVVVNGTTPYVADLKPPGRACATCATRPARAGATRPAWRSQLAAQRRRRVCQLGQPHHGGLHAHR